MYQSIPSIAIWSAIAVAASFGQTTVMLPPAADGTLYQDATGSLANGSGTLMFSGLNANSVIRRAIVRFDLTQIPAGSFVCSSSLQVAVLATTNNGVATIGLHPVTSAWGEGASVAGGAQGGGGAAQAGDATWLHSFHPTTFWNSPGGDMAAASSASADIFAPGVYSWTGAGIAIDVQDWVDNPASNRGWILKSSETTAQSMKHFGTREQTTAANRPVLAVTYYPSVLASVSSVGPGCAVPPSSLLTLATPVLPTIPAPLFGLSVNGGAPSGTAFIYLSPSLATPATGLPNGCLVLLDLAGVAAMIAAGISPLPPLSLDGGGTGFMPIPIPDTPCLGGTQVALQALSSDAQFAGGFAVSNALALLVGH
jgi:hypothetical protein